MRNNVNSSFTLYKTPTQDWYSADEVDKRIGELQYQYREMFLLRGMALKRIEELEAKLGESND